MRSFKRNLYIVLGIPFALLALTYLDVAVSPFILHPRTDFLYIGGNSPATEEFAVVPPGKLVNTGSMDAERMRREIRFFAVYDAETGARREADFAEAQRMVLDGSPVSPDGFEVVKAGGLLSFLEAGSPYRSTYLKKGIFYRKIEIGDQTRFLGWILALK
jgi:hypothetical protein